MISCTNQEEVQPLHMCGIMHKKEHKVLNQTHKYEDVINCRSFDAEEYEFKNTKIKKST